MAPALVEVARGYPQAKGGEVARRLLERAGLGELVEASHLDLREGRAVGPEGVEEDGRLVGGGNVQQERREQELKETMRLIGERLEEPGERESAGALAEVGLPGNRVLQRVPVEELVPYVVEVLQEPGGAGSRGGGGGERG
jgi:hypothetical protein